MKFLDLDQLKDILKAKREAKGWNKSQMARQLGISSQLYGQYEIDGKMPKGDFYIKWRRVFGEDLLAEFETMVSTGILNTPREEETSTKAAMVNLTEGNKILYEANRTLAEATKVLADAHIILTQGHQDLIDIMKILVQKGVSLPEPQPAPPKPDPSTHKVSAGFEKLSGKTRKAGSQEGK